jgi:hypothetical protein
MRHRYRILPLLVLAMMKPVGPAQAAFFGDDSDAPESSSVARGKAANRDAKEAADGLGLRRKRRAAIGISAAGQLGLAGANLELCLLPQSSFTAGFGGSDSYQAFSIGVRHIMGGETVMPYAGGGFARWSSSGRKNSAVSVTNPTFLGDSFMTDEQKRSGIISSNLLYGSLGLQYLAPSGAWAGSSVFIEAVLLAEISRLRLAPTGAFGYLYYF